jgi:hypothetical protein
LIFAWSINNSFFHWEFCIGFHMSTKNTLEIVIGAEK